MYLSDNTQAQLIKADDWFRLKVLDEPDPVPGWISATELVTTDTAYLSEALDNVARHYKTSNKRASAALWFGHYTGALMVIPVAAYLAERQAPHLDATRIQVRLDEEGNIAALAWGNLNWVALADDAANDNGQVTQLESIEALRDYLCQQFVVHLTPLVEAVRTRSGLGKASLWALAADYCSNSFSWVGDILGNQPAALEEARLIAAGSTPLKRKRGFIPIDHCGQHYELLDRVSCCLYYTTDEGGYCTSCPHRPVDERIERIKDWLEKKQESA